MKTFFARLTLPIKFALLGVLAFALIAWPTALFVLGSNATVVAKHIEHAGVPTERAIVSMLRAVQDHRGAVTRKMMSGDAAAETARRTQAARIETAVGQVAVEVKRIDQPSLNEEWQKVATAWQNLRSRVEAGSLDASRSFDLHVALIRSIVQFNGLLLDHYGMSLDADLDSFQLARAALVDIPALAEDLNRLRATGSIILTRKSSTPVETFTLMSMSDRANEDIMAFKGDFAKMASVNPGLARTLGERASRASQSTLDALTMTREKLTKAMSLELDPHAYAAAMTQVIDTLYKVDGGTLDALDDLLDRQAAAARRGQLSLLGGLLVSVVVAVVIALAIIRSITAPIRQAVTVAEQVAAGDLTSDVEVHGNNETAQLLRTLNAMTRDLRQLVTQVRGSANAIADSASEIAAGNADLSERTEEQAASLEQTASSLEELTATVKQNSDSAHQARDLGQQASEVAARGGMAVNSVVTTMSEIADSAGRIGEITNVIDGIAFQTNILALNAAVEAARASEHGRGFAVVASEVRALAQRSASAAKEIKALIHDSTSRIAAGARQASDAGHTVGDAVATINRLTGLINEIAAASAEQSTGIEQVNVAVNQMDSVTQQNAALVEQASAAAVSMADQARTLREGVAVFRVDGARTDTREHAATDERDGYSPGNRLAIPTGATPLAA
jgi:methyl-accepting chemotaxis protein